VIITGHAVTHCAATSNPIDCERVIAIAERSCAAAAWRDGLVDNAVAGSEAAPEAIV
jgi:hypothetical protein